MAVIIYAYHIYDIHVTYMCEYIYMPFNTVKAFNRYNFDLSIMP